MWRVAPSLHHEKLRVGEVVHELNYKLGAPVLRRERVDDPTALALNWINAGSQSCIYWALYYYSQKKQALLRDTVFFYCQRRPEAMFSQECNNITQRL